MKKKIAIIHPKMGWGGSEVTALFMIEALKNDYDVSFVTTGSFDANSINKYYGTSLKEGEFSLIKVPMPFGLKNTAKFAGLRWRFIQKYCQKISSQFDLMINNYNFCDFKKKSIQIATDIQELPEIMHLEGFKKMWYGKSFLRKIYNKICDFISLSNLEEWKKNITLTNSNWTGKLIKEKYGIDSLTLYPPVIGDFDNIEYNKKENGFVVIGRLIPEKKIDQAIKILKEVRNKFSNLHLHIIGGEGNDQYSKKLKKFCLENKDWIFFEGRLGDKEKNNLITNHKFGISCRKNEPFGIAVAEMVKAGCIVFVSNGGGQTEIVDDERLIYNDINDAVLKITNVIEDKEMQKSLLNHLFIASQRFLLENFSKQIKNLVQDFFNSN